MDCQQIYIDVLFQFQICYVARAERPPARIREGQRSYEYVRSLAESGEPSAIRGFLKLSDRESEDYAQKIWVQ